jgi:hypothetical protein
MEHSDSVAYLTNYPKLFKNNKNTTYWAQFKSNVATMVCTPEIINNRNKFVEDNNINKLCGYSWGSTPRNKKYFSWVFR